MPRPKRPAKPRKPRKRAPSPRSARKAQRKVKAGAAMVREVLAEVRGAPLPKAYWLREAAKDRRTGRSKARVRGVLRTSRDPLESIKPKLP